MNTQKMASITISIPKSSKDKMIRLIAQQCLRNPDEIRNISELGREIICKYLEILGDKEMEI